MRNKFQFNVNFISLSSFSCYEANFEFGQSVGILFMIVRNIIEISEDDCSRTINAEP
jgi:hypothetical protein